MDWDIKNEKIKFKKKCVREDGILFIEFLRVILKIICECEKSFFFLFKIKNIWNLNYVY